MDLPGLEPGSGVYKTLLSDLAGPEWAQKDRGGNRTRVCCITNAVPYALGYPVSWTTQNLGERGVIPKKFGRRARLVFCSERPDAPRYLSKSWFHLHLLDEGFTKDERPSGDSPGGLSDLLSDLD